MEGGDEAREVSAKPSLKGLAKKLADDPVLRHHLLTTGTFFKWPAVKCTGIVNFQSIAVNSRLLEYVVDLWCPQHTVPKTLQVEQARDEAG